MKLDKHGKVKLSEAEVRGQIKGFLATQGVYIGKPTFKNGVYRGPGDEQSFLWWNHQSMGCYPGIPDMEGCYYGRLFFIETKKPGGQLSYLQERFVARLNYHNQKIFVADNLDRFMREWNEWARKEPKA